MDIIQRPTQPLALPEDIREEKEKQNEGVTRLQAFSTGIRNRNWASQHVYEMMDGTEEENAGTDINYRPLEDEINEEYPPSRMIRARSEGDAVRIRNQIDSERRDLEVIEANGWGMAGQLFGDVFRPENLIGGMAKSVPGVIAAEMTAEAFNQRLLHTQQELLTKEESYLNIGMAGVVSGVLAGAMPLYGKARSTYYDWDTKRRFKPIGGGGDDAPQPDIPIEDPVKADLKTAGSKVRGVDVDLAGKVIKERKIKAQPTLEQNEMAGEGVLGWLAHKLSIGPGARLMQNKSVTAVEAAQKMVSSSLMTRSNQKGLTQGISAEDAAEATMGRTGSAIENVYKMRKDSGISPDEFEHEIGVAMSAFDKHPNPKVQEAAELFRKQVVEPIEADAKALKILARNKDEVQLEIDKILREPPKKLKRPTKDGRTHAKKRVPSKKLLQELEDAPMSPVKKGESYFPRMYSKSAIYKNWDMLSVELMDFYRAKQPELSPEVLKIESVHTMQNMLGGTPIGSGSPGGLPSALKPRTVEQTDAMLERYLDKGAISVMIRHTRSMSAYIEMKKAFGDETLSEVFEQVRADYLPLIDKAATPNAKKKLNKELNDSINDLIRLRDRVLNQVHKDNPSSGFQRAIRGMGKYNMVTQLGGIVLSSFPDIGMPLQRYGARSYAAGLNKAVKQAVSSWGGEGATKAQLSRMNVALDRTLNTKLANMADDMEIGEKISERAGQIFGKWTGFNAWTDAMETVSAHAGMDWTLKQAKKLKEGKRLTKSELGRLGRQGLSHDELIRVYDEAFRAGGTKDPVLQFADTLLWKDAALGRKFEAAIGGDVRRTIVRVTKGDKPLAMDEPLVGLIFQYSGFAIATTNKLLVSGMQQADRDVAVGLLAMIGLGAFSGAVKETLRGGDPSKWSAEKMIYEGIDRSGMVGLYRPALSALMAARGEMPSRYLTRSAESVFFGPTIGSIGNVSRLGMSAAKGDWSDAGERALKATPLVNNGLHIRQILTRMAED